ncbi:MAG: hypothetical protein ACOH2F_20310 [Cellulomonas sp.]
MKELGMRAWAVFFGGVVAALLSVFALDHVLPASWSLLPSVLYGVIVMGAGLGTQLIKRHREHVAHTAEDGSIEREIARRAASGTYGAALVAMLVFGLYLVLQDQFADAFVLYLLIWAVIAAYWIRYAIIRQRLT